jgi:hypothetical protein
MDPPVLLSNIAIDYLTAYAPSLLRSKIIEMRRLLDGVYLHGKVSL